MAKAITARRNGDDYQALFFWKEVSKMFSKNTNIDKVGYEYEQVKSFDDVVTFYATPVRDCRGNSVNVDYYQIKFHVDFDEFFTYENLTSPEFIGATSQSLLQKLSFAQQNFAPDGDGVRFHLVSTRQLHPDNKLRNLISTEEGQIRLSKLFSPRNNKRIRQHWCKNLELCDEEELKLILKPLRIRHSFRTFEELRSSTNRELASVGFKSIDKDKAVFPYVPLIHKLHSEDKTIFTREELQAIAEREGLWAGNNSQDDGAVYLGVRSFARWAEQMENWTERMICFVEYFDNRIIKDINDWQGTIYPKVKNFIAESTKANNHYRIYLDTHNSISFATGYEIPAKAGVNIFPMQTTKEGRVFWEPNHSSKISSDELWNVNHKVINDDENANDVALAVSVSRVVLQDVELYAEENLPSLGKIIDCKVNPNPGQTAIKDADHGFQLVEQLVNILSNRNINERNARLHIFASAPNAMLFWLGQQAHGLGSITIYEYDFETMKPGGYLPALKFPA